MTIIEITAALLVQAYDDDTMIPTTATVHDVADGHPLTRLTLDGVNITADDCVSLHWTLTDTHGKMSFFHEICDEHTTITLALTHTGHELDHELTTPAV